jgi:hypothetical protein
LEREMNTHRKEEDVENENDDSVREMMIVWVKTKKISLPTPYLFFTP